jgi:hypothetical protein
MRCLHCKEKFEKRFKYQQGRFKYCLLTDECIKSFNDRRKKYDQEQYEKKKRADKKNKKIIHSSIYITDNKATLQAEINHIARLIDKGCRCVDCDKTEAKPCWDGGHRKSRGSTPNLRFHLDNIFKQTRYCNYKSEGDKEAYNNGIKEMYGIEYYEFVDGLNLLYPSLKMIHSDYPPAIKEARKIIRELKALDMTYPPNVRIQLRKEYNKRLGIYE